jgi:hypothetical protein
MFLRSRYPQHRAKTLARIFSVSVSTAQRWLDGYPPTLHHLEKMHLEWGEPIIRAAFPDFLVKSRYSEDDERKNKYKSP